MRAVTTVIALLLCVATAANAMSILKLKAQRQAVLHAQAKAAAVAKAQVDGEGDAEAGSEFIIKLGPFDNAIAGCDHANVGQANCAKLTDAATTATAKIAEMITHLGTHHRDADFTAAFGGSAEQAVHDALVAMRDGKLVLWNSWSKKDGTVDQNVAGAQSFGGLGVLGTGSTKLVVGPNAYSLSKDLMAENLIHETSHAFANTIDWHGPQGNTEAKYNGYKDSGYFANWKGANNADSYRVYAQLVAGNVH